MRKLIVLLIALSFVVSCSVLPSTRPEQKIYVATLPLEECKKAIAEEPLAEEPVKAVFKLEEAIMFDFDEYAIRDDQVSKVDDLAEMLNDNLDTFVIIDGYASKEGPKEYNQILSENRANAVKDALVDRGVDANRIKTISGKGATSIFGEILKLNRKAVIVSVR